MTKLLSIGDPRRGTFRIVDHEGVMAAMSSPTQKGTPPMSTHTPGPDDVAYSKQLHERAVQLRVVDGTLSYPQAVMRASEQLRRGERISDPDLLHSMAQRYAVDHKVPYREALIAVGPEYDIVSGPAAAAASAADDSDELDRTARRRMAEDPRLTYREALLGLPAGTAAAKTPPRPSSRRRSPSSSGVASPSADELRAYAKDHGVSAKEALLELMGERPMTGEEE